MARICFVLFAVLFFTPTLLAQRFYDVADSLGLVATPNSHYLGSGVSVYDFNQDGWDDLSFPMPNDSCLFYLNDSGQFVKAPHFIDGFGEAKHILWVDYDNDSDLDIALSTFDGQYKLFNNDGEFNFTDVSIEAGLMQGVARYYGMCFGDYDRDGYLDFYVTCYTPASHEQTFNRLNHLYRNNGDGTFTNVTLEAGVGDGWRLSFQAVWLDYDMDGWPDLFVINDHSFENSLYKNNGDGTFTDVSSEAGIKFAGHNPMTITVGDFDNDGDLDIYMTNSYAFEKRAMLLVNNGDGTFTNQSQQLGVDVFAWTWGAIWFDMDNDADQDLFVATGHISPNVSTNENYLFENFEGQFFEDVTLSELYGQDNRRSYGVGRGDFDNDGYHDVVVANRHPFNANLWQNSGGENNYVKVTLQGTLSNSMAIGSWIRLYSNGQQYTQYTLCGENYIGQNSQHLIFGVGLATTIDSVSVEYISGHTDTYYNLPVDTHYYFTEGETFNASITTSGSWSLCEGEELVLDAGDHAYFLWNTGDSERYLAVTEEGDYWVEVQTEAGWSSISDTVSVQVFEAPYIQAEIFPPLCFGDTTGALSIQNMTGVPLHIVEWKNGYFGNQVESIGAGNYAYSAIDTNGCTASGTIQLFDPYPLSVLVYVLTPTSGTNGSIALFINGGTPPYTVLLDGETASTTIDGLTPGTYELTVFDDNLCSFNETVLVMGSTGIEETSTRIQVFPNPAQHYLQIIHDQDIRSGAVFSTDGRHVLDLPSPPSGRIDVSQLVTGNYHILLKTADQNTVAIGFIKE